jgi:hypothetical protein
MKLTALFSVVFIFLIFLALAKPEPGFNGTTPGCGGNGCHTSKSGVVTAEVLSNFQVKITVSGTSSKVAGELVNAEGQVVAVQDPTSSNPFTLTAPAAGVYTVNAGYKDPSREWGSTSANVTVTGVDEKLIGLKPEAFELYSNYPNPFNPSTKIRYAISQSAFTTLKVYSIMGQEVATLINEQKSPGVYEVSFDGLKLSSGTYIYKLQAGDYIQTKKMLLIK